MMTANIFITTLRRINLQGPVKLLQPISCTFNKSLFHTTPSIFQDAKSSKEEVATYDNISDDPKDRSRLIPLETSMSYLESDAYRRTYGDHRVIFKKFSIYIHSQLFFIFYIRFGSCTDGITPMDEILHRHVSSAFERIG